MAYVDGYILAVRKDHWDDYVKMATLGRDVWKEYGALSYCEAKADDVPYGETTSFPRAVQATDDHIVVFSYITYRDRAHRDQVNAKVMADPRMGAPPETMPFDGQTMIFGGFTPFVEG